MLNVPSNVKNALRSGMYHKNYRFNVMQADGKTVDFTIDNNNLISESVSFDERMCSGDYIKFGLCEGTSLEFEYFGFPNIIGRRIQAFIDVEYKDNGELATYPIPMGWYDVDKCPRQVSTGIRKVTAFNKLRSKVLDAKANSMLDGLFVNKPSTLKMYDLKRLLLKGYDTDDRSETDVEIAKNGTSSGCYDDATTTKFNKVFGDYDSPINAFNCDIHPTDNVTAFNFGVESNFETYTLDPSKYYKIDSVFDLDKLEEAMYDYMWDMLSAAGLNVSTNTIMQNLVTNAKGAVGISNNTKRTWKYIFCIWLTKANGTVEYYSKVCADNGVTVAGTMGDLSKKLFTGYKEITIVTPDTLAQWKGAIGDYPYFPDSVDDDYPYYKTNIRLWGENDIPYKYWVKTPDYYEEAQAPVPYPVFKIDGETITRNYSSETIKIRAVEGILPAELVEVSTTNMPSFTLRDIASAVYETDCKYGRLNRETDLFSGVSLNNGSLDPQEAITPLDEPYTIEEGEEAFKSTYNKLWMDEGGTESFRYLIITYKGLDGNGQEKEYTLQRTVNEHGTQNYNMSSNWMFKNLTWTSAQVATYANAMVQKMRNITWFPFEMSGAGLPYVDTGDEIEILAGGERHTSYVLERQLKGIQNLEDTYMNGELDVF